MKVGDVVVLKSGGPKMTIVWKEHETSWMCSYFHNNKMEQVRVPEDALELWREPDDSADD